MNYERPELIDKLTGEYALGTLRGPARRRFRRLLAASPAMQTALREWQERLARLSLAAPAVTPPARTWSGVEHRLGWHSPPRELPPELPPALGWLAVLTRHAGLRAALLFAGGLALGLGVVVGMPESFIGLDRLAQREQALPQSYVGLLVDAQGRPTVLASATRHGDRMTLKILRKIEVPPGKVLQLWALPQDAQGNPLPPFPLGTLPAEGKGEFRMADTAERLLSKVGRLGVSVQDGPGGQPGDFVLTGHCVKLW